MLNNLCARCDVCTFMPKQGRDRVLVSSSISPASSPSRVLVIDDMCHPYGYGYGEDIALVILGSIPFDYTTTIRCHYTEGEITTEQKQTALMRCSVWTKNLVGNYSIYLCTQFALEQLGCGEDRKPGDAFVNSRLGLVLCIEPLTTIKPDDIASYKTKVQRLLKKAGMA